MKTDKSKINLDEQVVFDKSLRGKSFETTDGDPRKEGGTNFKDQGRARGVPTGAKNLLCQGQKVPSKVFRERYDNIKWNCKVCNKPEEECLCETFA